MGANVHGKNGERIKTMLARQNILEIEHSIYIHGMGQIMLEAPKLHTVRRTPDQYMMMRLQLTAEARVWMETPLIEKLIPLQ